MRMIDPDDTPRLRKERGAFFTPPGITEFVASWAIRTPSDRVLEPAAGDAAFLIAAVERLAGLRPAITTASSELNGCISGA